MTARRTGPRAKRGSKSASRAKRAQAKPGAGNTGPARKKATASTEKSRVRKKSPSVAAAKKRTARKKPIAARRAGKKPATKESARGTAAAAKPRARRGVSPRGFRIAATRSRELGRIGQAFRQARAAVLELSGELRIGDWIAVRGPTTDFTQRVESLRLDDAPVDSAGAGDTVGIATRDRTRVGDRVERLDP